MDAIFWITILLNVAAKLELVGSKGLKNQKGKSDVFFFVRSGDLL